MHRDSDRADQLGWRPGLALTLSIVLLLPQAAGFAQEPVEIPIVYVTQIEEETLPLSLVEPIITDKGLGCTRMGIDDNATTGKFLQQTYSPRFSDFALEFYTFLADNCAPFYSTPIECTDRDAAFVLDGLLYNESDLELEEHYTDTHGYTEINFAAFAMLGRRFCPRIRGLRHQRISASTRNATMGHSAAALVVPIGPSPRT